MKYQLSILINLTKRKFWKWLLLDYIFIILYVIIQKYITGFYDSSFVENLLILKEISNYNVVELLLSIFNVSLIIYIVYNLYIYEYNNSFEFIFLRVSNIKRNSIKLFFIILFTFIVRTIYFLFIFMFFRKEFNFFSSIYINTITTYISISLITYLAICLFYSIHSNLIEKM